MWLKGEFRGRWIKEEVVEGDPVVIFVMKQSR